VAARIASRNAAASLATTSAGVILNECFTRISAMRGLNLKDNTPQNPSSALQYHGGPEYAILKCGITKTTLDYVRF
jgi:hypothetical protein